MSTLCAPGYYRDIPVVVRIDPSLATSTLSTDFTLTHSVPLSVSVSNGIALRSVSGPLQVPTATGKYISTLRVSVGYVSGADVVLGSDWIDVSGTSAVGQYLADPTAHSSDARIVWEAIPSCKLIGVILSVYGSYSILIPIPILQPLCPIVPLALALHLLPMRAGISRPPA